MKNIKGLLEILLVIAAILLIPLFFAMRSQAAQGTDATPTVAVVEPVIWATATPTGTAAENTAVPPTAIPPAAPETATGQQPPACIFPLAQTTTVESKPENYTFSEPKVVLTNSNADAAISVVEWLPDNQRVLIMRDIAGKGQQSIEIFNPQNGDIQVYAIRTTLTDAPPSWVSGLNAVVYPEMNITKNDKTNHHIEFTRQAWASQGDPKHVQLFADNMKQFYIAVKPDGSQISYLSEKQLSKRNTSTASLPDLPSLSFDLTQWAAPLASFQAIWRPGASQVFLYNTSYVPSIPGYTFLLDSDSGQICTVDLGSGKSGHAWAGVGRWSPNGRYLAAVRASGTLPLAYSDLAVLDTATGKLYTMDIASQEENGHHFVKDIDWAPDSQHLIAIAGASNNGNMRSGLYLVDFTSGEDIHLLPAYEFSEGWWGTNLAWSPDGSKLLTLCQSDQGTRLCLLDVQKNIQP